MSDEQQEQDVMTFGPTKRTRAQQHHVRGSIAFSMKRDGNGSAREVWDAALRSRIYQYTERLARYDGIERDARLHRLLPDIERRRARFESRLYENLSDEQRAVVDRMSPPGKVRAWACSNKEF